MEDKQRIVKINKNISDDLDFVSKEMGVSKSEVIEQQMKVFIDTVEKGLIDPQPEKKAVGIIVPNEIFDKFKDSCKAVNYGIGEALEILINQYNFKNLKKINKNLEDKE